MAKLNAADIQGFAMRGYTFPVARFVFLEIVDAPSGQALLRRVLDQVTTAERWDVKPDSTLNIAFTYQGLVRLGLPDATLLSFPVEFVQGMKARAEVLEDTGVSAPEKWEPAWRTGGVHAWVGIYAESPEVLQRRCKILDDLLAETGGAHVLHTQDASLLSDGGGKYCAKEHFGYTDGFGNPDFDGADRKSQPGQGKLTADGQWAPLATGEFLLGYADEAGELPVAPVPHLLAKNGTFMVYRKLHQNVATFREYLDEHGSKYAGGKEKLAAKFVGRWPDGTPLELSPERPDPSLVNDPARNTKFTYGSDPEGTRCPIGSHIRRAHPRDAFGFNGQLVNRRRIMRRGLPYGRYAQPGEPVTDAEEHGVIFMVLNASIFRQFEFVQQQWIQYGNDSHQGTDRDLLLGKHDHGGRFMIQGDTDPANPPYMCTGLRNFVELRGGEYFFMPSLTALALIATDAVDPR
jgi:Dyp-type peroxidase family